MLVRATINIGGLEAGEVGDMDDALARRRMAKGWVVPADGEDDTAPTVGDEPPTPSKGRGQTMRAVKPPVDPEPSA